MITKTKNKIRTWIKVWERRGYDRGIPDEAYRTLEAYGLVPSYRRICLALLKNDIQLLSLGFTKGNCELYNQLKRIEIAERIESKYINTQLRFPW